MARSGVLSGTDGLIDENVEKYQWAWIDTICIMRSSAELSEAINSMYKWYKDADICLVFLPDVTIGEIREEDQFQNTGSYRSQLVHSIWFTRGWTLQELIAPHRVLFYDNCLRVIGSILRVQSTYWNGFRFVSYTDTSVYHDHPFCEAVAEAAHMDIKALISSRADSIADVMSWAALRQTTRAEDMAYCLLGLCGVNMPLLYGEGGDRAFQRLQLEIIASNPDLSIFAFHAMNSSNWTIREDIGMGMLASNVSQFANCKLPLPENQRYGALTKTPRGFEFELRIPRGLRNRYAGHPLLLMTLTSKHGNGNGVHVLLQGVPTKSNDIKSLVCRRAGCYSSDTLVSERALWEQVMGWRELDRTMLGILELDSLESGTNSWGIMDGILRPYPPISPLRRARKMVNSVLPSKPMKVVVT